MILLIIETFCRNSTSLFKNCFQNIMTLIIDLTVSIHNYCHHFNKFLIKTPLTTKRFIVLCRHNKSLKNSKFCGIDINKSKYVYIRVLNSHTEQNTCGTCLNFSARIPNKNFKCLASKKWASYLLQQSSMHFEWAQKGLMLKRR